MSKGSDSPSYGPNQHQSRKMLTRRLVVSRDQPLLLPRFRADLRPITPSIVSFGSAIRFTGYPVVIAGQRTCLAVRMASSANPAEIRCRKTFVRRTRAGTMPRVAASKIDFIEPWRDFVPGQGEAFMCELRRELSPGHPLEGLELSPLGHSDASDDALFEAQDGRVFQVHLTHSHHVEPIPFPRYRVYTSADEWVQSVMRPANEEHLG